MDPRIFEGQIASAWVQMCPNLKPLQGAANLTIGFVQINLAVCVAGKVAYLTVLYSNIIAYSLLVLACLGMVGSLLTVITFYTTKSMYFRAPTYRFFKLLILVQSMVMVGYVHYAIRQLMSNQESHSYVWYFITVYLEPIFEFVGSSWADFIICYLSIERAVACLFPAYFHHLITIKCFCLVSFLTFLAACIGDLPTVAIIKIGYNNQTAIYSTVAATGFAAVGVPRIRTSWWGIKCLILIVSTTTVIGGFYAAHKRRVRLLHIPANAHNQQSHDEWKVTRQLCILQLAQAVPAIVSSLFFLISTVAAFTANIPLNMTALYVATDDQISSTLTILNLFCCGVTSFAVMSFLGHCIHFYMYVAFSRPFRAAAVKALEVVLKCGSNKTMVSVYPSQGTGTTNTNSRHRSQSQSFAMKTVSVSHHHR